MRDRPAPAEDREDWRDLPLVTIDPPDARDHDDAVHAAPDASPDNPGGFLVTVAIADVAFYVRPGSAMDREALARGNSVYFPDRVVPMLPEVADAIEGLSALSLCRQAGVRSEIASLGDRVVGGHWGDVWFDTAGAHGTAGPDDLAWQQ